MSTEPVADTFRDESGSHAAESASADVVPLGEALRAWFVISLQTSGGPAGQIAVMQPRRTGASTRK